MVAVMVVTALGVTFPSFAAPSISGTAEGAIAEYMAALQAMKAAGAQRQ